MKFKMSQYLKKKNMQNKVYQFEHEIRCLCCACEPCEDKVDRKMDGWMELMDEKLVKCRKCVLFLDVDVFMLCVCGFQVPAG